MSSEVQEQSADYKLADLKPVLEKASGNKTLLDSLPIWLRAQTRKSAGRGRGADNTHQYGVQKLRELILELAVRGKLVPQNPNDEPADVLLEKVAEKKAELVKNGFAKKEKKLPSINEDEEPFAAPHSWHWARLPEVYISISPSGKKLKTSELKETGKYPVVDQGQSHIAGYFDDESLLIEIPNPVVVFGDHTKALKYIDFNFIPGADGTKILCPVAIFPRYFYLHLLAYNLEDRGYGRHYKILNSNLFAVPPLAEQHRIVKKVDELMALCDKLEQQQADAVQAHDTLVKVLLDTLTQSDNADDFQQNWRRIAEHFDTLFTTESSIDQLKQTLLQLAVMGKLVPQDPNDEPASLLLEKIAQEKARLFKEGKIKKQKSLPEISENEKPFDLPTTWQWTRLGRLAADIHYGYTASADHSSSDVRLLRITDIQNDSVNWHSVPGCAIEDKNIPTYKLENGDLLIARTGGTIGKSYLVENIDVCSVFASYLIRVKRISTMYPQFIKSYLGSQLYWHQLYGSSMGTGQPNVNGNALKNLVFPLPPLAEQHRIVKKVDELMALCDQLKERLNQAQTLQQQLADAVVEQTVN